MPTTYALRGKLWVHPGAAGWHFVTVPKRQGQEIRRFFGGDRAWGSVPVTVTIGGATWRTSLFPDGKTGSYLLPVKAAVRRAEGLAAGSTAAYTLRIEE